MRNLIKSILLLVCSINVAQAALIETVPRFTNDGVFTLTAAQAALLGTPGADKIGFLRVRSAAGSSFAAGSILELSSLGNISNGGAILAFFNGTNSDLSYTGGAFELFTKATVVNAADGFFRGLAFAFSSSSGNIVFSTGGATAAFNGGQTRGALTESLATLLEESLSTTQVSAPTTLGIFAFAATAFFLRRRQSV